MSSEQPVGQSVSKYIPVRLRRQAIGVGGLAVAAVVMAITGGLRGAVVAGLIFSVGLVVPAPIAFGVGVAGLLAIDGVSVATAVVAGAGLGAVFVDQNGGTASRNHLTSVAIVGVILSSVTVWLLSQWSLQAVVFGVSACIAGGVYVIHRYERVTLGLVSQ